MSQPHFKTNSGLSFGGTNNFLYFSSSHFRTHPATDSWLLIWFRWFLACVQNVKKARREFSPFGCSLSRVPRCCSAGKDFPARRKIKIPRLSHSRFTGLEIRVKEVMIKETGVSPWPASLLVSFDFWFFFQETVRAFVQKKSFSWNACTSCEW